MSASQDLRSSSSDSDSDLSFEVISESHPNDDIISESDASDCEEQAVSFDDVENICSGLSSGMNALSVQLEKIDKDEEVVKKQEKTSNSQADQLAKRKAESERMYNLFREMNDPRRSTHTLPAVLPLPWEVMDSLGAGNWAKEAGFLVTNDKIDFEKKENAEILRNLKQVWKRDANKMLAEFGNVETQFLQTTQTAMGVGSETANNLCQLETRNMGLEKKLAEQEEEKRAVLEEIEILKSEKNELIERLKNAEEMRTSEVKKLQTMYQEHTEQSKQVQEKQNKYLLDYFFEKHDLKHRLAEKEAENEKNLREISNLKDERHELIEKLHQECDSMEEMTNEMMVLTADLNEMQAEHQRVTLENMELNEQKATLEEDRQMNLTIIRGLHDGRDKLEMELRRTAAMFHQKNQACSELHKRIRDLEESKADLVAGFQALDHRNVQLEARIAERDEEKIGDMEEIQNLRKFKNELLEEMKGKEYHANEQIGELTRRNLALEEQIRAGDEVAENLKKESAQERKTIEQELRVMAEERQQFEEKYKKYKQIAHGYKKKCEELSQQSTRNQSQSIGNKTDFKKQINGRWALASSRESSGFTLPERYHNWTKGHLVCELKDNQFTTSIHIGSVPTNTEHFMLETVACFMKNDALYTVDYKPAPHGMVARHYFENGLLKIKVKLNNATGIYSFIKAE